MDIAVDLIDGQPPEIASLILDAEYGAILSGATASVKTAMSLRLIKGLSWHIHYDQDYYGYLLCTENLWGMKFLNMLPGHFIRIFQKR